MVATKDSRPTKLAYLGSASAPPKRRRTQRHRQCGRKTHGEQLGCCATHLRRHKRAPSRRYNTARPTRPHGRRPPPLVRRQPHAAEVLPLACLASLACFACAPASRSFRLLFLPAFFRSRLKVGVRVGVGVRVRVGIRVGIRVRVRVRVELRVRVGVRSSALASAAPSPPRPPRRHRPPPPRPQRQRRARHPPPCAARPVSPRRTYRPRV